MAQSSFTKVSHIIAGSILLTLFAIYCLPSILAFAFWLVIFIAGCMFIGQGMGFTWFHVQRAFMNLRMIWRRRW